MMAGPEAASHSEDTGFSSATEMTELIQETGQEDVGQGIDTQLAQVSEKVDTRINKNWNDEVAHRRMSEAAKEEKVENYRIRSLIKIVEQLTHASSPTQDLSDEATAYLRGGGSLEEAWAEILEYSEHGPVTARRERPVVDVELSASRTAYIEAMAQRRTFFRKKRVDAQRKDAEERYIGAVLGKFEQILQTDPKDALEVGQLPQTVERMSFTEGDKLTLEEVAGNHLFLLVDVLLREQLQRAKIISRQRSKGAARVMDALQGNRKLRVGMALGIFGSALLPKLGIAPESQEHMMMHLETGLQMVSGYIFVRELQEGGYEGFKSVAEKRKISREHRALSESKRLSDLTLRTAYNQVEYGENAGFDPIADRVGTDDPAENLRRFENLDHDFEEYMPNVPGGKPYSGEQVMDYASRLYLHHLAEIKQITGDEQGKEAYMQLVQDILREDVAKLRREMVDNKLRRMIIRGASLAASVVLTRITSGLGEAATLSRDTVKTVQNEMAPPHFE